MHEASGSKGVGCRPAFAVACGGGGGSPDATASHDASLSDASLLDAATDASPDGAPLEWLDVTVRNRCCDNEGFLLGNVPIVIRDAEGDLTASITTNLDGRAFAMIEPGSSVTAIYPQLNNLTELVTFIGVAGRPSAVR